MSYKRHFRRSWFHIPCIESYFYHSYGVCVIEWSDIIEELLPEDTINMTITGDGNTRTFECESGEKHINYIKEAAEKAGAEIEE